MSLRYLFNLLRPQSSKFISVRNAADKPEKGLIVFEGFETLAKKDKKTYLDMIKIFETNDIRRRGHVEFIYAALRNMKDFGVQKDLEAYKSLLEVLPKGRFIPTNFIQSEFLHYPKQQQCGVDLLEQMEDNGVMPDRETQDILMSIYGKRGIPLRKYWRMMYWMPKFKNLSPWPIPDVLPDDAQELAKLAIKRITSVDVDMNVEVFETKEIQESLDETWIVSAQSPTQISLLAKEAEIAKKQNSGIAKTIDNKTDALIVRGAFIVYLRDQSVSYFTLTGPVRQTDFKKIDTDDVSNLSVSDTFGSAHLPALAPTAHEQDDGTILAVCATGTSSRDSLLSWIRLLEKNGNPGLANLPVIFTLTAPSTEIVLQETTAPTNEDVTRVLT